MAGKIKLNLEEFIVQIISLNVRTVDGINETIKTFKNNIHLLESDNYLHDVLCELHDTKASVDELVIKCEPYFKTLNAVDFKMANKFAETLTYVPLNYEISGNVIAPKLPKCTCDTRVKDNRHLLQCYEIVAERDSIVLEEMKMNCYFFKEKFTDCVKALSVYPDIQIGEAFMACQGQLEEINCLATNYYYNLGKGLNDKAFESFTNEQRVNFHSCMLEIHSFKEISSWKDVTEIEFFFTRNLKKLGLHYYVRLNCNLDKLKRTSVKNTFYFYNELSCIANEEKLCLNNKKELSIFKDYVSQILVRSIRNDVEKTEISENLKKLGKYMILSSYWKLMRIFNDDNIGTDKKLYSNFYYLLNEIKKYTEENGFI